MCGYSDHSSLLFVQASKGNLTRGGVKSRHQPCFVGDIKFTEHLCNSVAFTPGKMLLDVDYGILYRMILSVLDPFAFSWV
jgi:hypothetical protein